jgi:UMF1 family MFS transporter
LPDTATAVKASFVSVAIWWAVFTIPLLRRVPEPPAPGGRVSIADGFRRLRSTFREIRRYRQLLLFLIAYWVYSDGIGTIVKMATAFGSEIGIGLSDLVGALVLTQLIGLPSTLAFGRLAGRFGSRPSLILGLAVYAAICIGGFFLRTPLHFYLLAALVGMVQGGTQALSRSLYATLVPKHRTGEFFGFFATSGRFAGIAGPLLFGLLSHLTGQSRLSILALIVFFVTGGLLLLRVDFAAGRVTARDAERAVTEG